MATYKIRVQATGHPVIEVTPEAADQFATTTTGSRVENGLLKCGEVRTTAGKRVRLSLKIEGKPELAVLIADLQARQAEIAQATAAREARVAAIPGLAALRAAISAREDAYARYQRASEHGYPAREAHAWHVAEHVARDLATEYPHAAGYLKAEAWSRAANYAKAAAGSRAMARMADGEDYMIVLADMEAEWTAAARRAVENS